MSRYQLLLAGVITLATLAAGGCRSCSSCHDYDPPVAGCQCNACGTHRAGSASGGDCSTCSGGSSGNCSSGNCSTCNGGGDVEGDYSGGGMPGESYSEGMISE